VASFACISEPDRLVLEEALETAARYVEGPRRQAYRDLAEQIRRTSLDAPADDGPEVFVVFADGRDATIFTTRELADEFGDALLDSYGRNIRVEQQTVCGPARAGEMVADIYDED
jgi:hypothetical protein